MEKFSYVMAHHNIQLRRYHFVIMEQMNVEECEKYANSAEIPETKDQQLDFEKKVETKIHYTQHIFSRSNLSFVSETSQSGKQNSHTYEIEAIIETCQ